MSASELCVGTASASNNHNYSIQFRLPFAWHVRAYMFVATAIAQFSIRNSFPVHLLARTHMRLKHGHRLNASDFVIKWKPINNSLFNGAHGPNAFTMKFPWVKCIETHGKLRWQTTENQQQWKNQHRLQRPTPGVRQRETIIDARYKPTWPLAIEWEISPIVCELRMWNVYTNYV